MPGKPSSNGAGGRSLRDRLKSDPGSSPKSVHLADFTHDSELVPLIDELLDQDAALMVARTSDGGALCITVYVDRERFKRYAATSAEWDAIVAGLVR